MINFVGHVSKKKIGAYLLLLEQQTTNVESSILYLVYELTPEFSLHFGSFKSRRIHQKI